MLTNEQVRKFQEIYKKRFGKEIFYEEALSQGIKLINLVKNVYKPLPKTNLK